MKPFPLPARGLLTPVPIACVIGAIFFAVGAITVEGQSVEASANPLVSETLPAGAAAALRPPGTSRLS
jgi:hypothetical protein